MTEHLRIPRRLRMNRRLPPGPAETSYDGYIHFGTARIKPKDLHAQCAVIMDDYDSLPCYIRNQEKETG